MTNTLISQLQAVLPPAMTLPTELIQLYHWIEDNHLYVDGAEHLRYGYLYENIPLETQAMSEAEAITHNDGGTTIEFMARGSQYLCYWFGGKENEFINSRLCVFAQSGSDGSECALWLDDNDKLKIVHMGSGSGSLLTCVLADNFLDFLRLLAIGYDEICWDEDYPSPPTLIHPEFAKFQNWVTSTFKATIPHSAFEIVKHPTSLDADTSADEFFNWCQKYIT